MLNGDAVARQGPATTADEAGKEAEEGSWWGDVLIAGIARVCRVCRVSASAAAESISLPGGTVRKPWTPAGSLDVDEVAGMLPVAGTLVAGKQVVAGISRLEEGIGSAGMLPVVGVLAVGTLLANPSRLLEEGSNSAASGDCVPAGAVSAGKPVPAGFLAGMSALPPCLPLALNSAGCFLAETTGCHCSSSSSDVSPRSLGM